MVITIMVMMMLAMLLLITERELSKYLVEGGIHLWYVGRLMLKYIVKWNIYIYIWNILSNEMWLCAMVKACPDSYLSRISQIIFVETKLSCGEIWSFYKDFEQFVEFYQSFCRFCSQFIWRKICVEKVCVEKKWQKRGLVLDGALEPDQKAYGQKFRQ